MLDNSVKPGRKREDQIQFLRFIMFLFVCFFHTGMWGVYHYPDENGAISAVSFFFMLSGTLCGFYAKEKKCKLSVRNIVSDVFRRVKKLYGLYFITTVYAIFISEIPELLIESRFSEMKMPLLQLVRNLLMIQSWFPTGFFSYSCVNWFLSTLMFLYVLNLPLTALLKWIHIKSKHELISIVGMVLCFGSTAIYCYYTYADTENVHFWQYIFPPSRIGQYVFGAFMGYYISLIKNRLHDGRVTWVFFTVAEISVLLFWFVSLYFSPIDSWRHRQVDWFLPNMLVIGMFFVGKGGISQLFRMKAFVKLGNVSAECYLLHTIVHYLFITLSGVTPVSRMDNLICVGLPLLFTITLAFFCNRTPNT